MHARTVSILHDDAHQAGRQTAAELLAELGQPPDLVLVFTTSRHEPERVLDGMWSVLPSTTRLLGCSSFAEIGAEDAMAGSVTAMGIVFHSVQWDLVRLDELGASSSEAGAAFGRKAAALQPKLVIALPDGAVDNPKFVRALQDAVGPDCVVAGGVASDELQFSRTFELFDRQVLRGGVVGLALRGPVTVTTAARAGFQPVGTTRTCTRVEDGRIILEIDGESALDLYKRFLGPEIADRPNIGTEFPLALVVTPGSDYMESDERSQVIRVVRVLDDERGALVCSGDIYEGAKVRMTRAIKDDLIKAAQTAAAQARHAVPSTKAGFFFSCVGRRLVLGARCQDEVHAAREALGAEIPTIGFYTYGEIAPVDGRSMSHDETFTLALVGTE